MEHEIAHRAADAPSVKFGASRLRHEARLFDRLAD
jgi:hypothetical protein